MQEIEVIKCQHATKDINQRWHIPAEAAVRSRIPFAVRCALLSKTWRPYVIVHHDLSRGRQDILLQMWSMFLHTPFLVACSWRHFFTCFFTCLFLLFIYFLCCSLRLFYVWAGIFFFPMTCSAAHWDNNNICERKERNECMSKHTQGKTCWQVFHCGCHMTGGNSCITLRSTEQQQPWHLQ